MTVIIKLDTGDTFRIDRTWHADDVRIRVDTHRGDAALVELPDDSTPSRPIYIDPKRVVAIYDNGRSH